jgi:hypothetical protein
LLDQKKKKEEAMRQQIEQKRNEEIKSTPEINKKSKVLITSSRGVDAQASWDEIRKEK